MNTAAFASEIQPLLDELAEPVRGGIDALIASFTLHISQQEKHISQQEKHISEQQKRISEQEKHISEQEKHISEQQKRISEQEKRIAILEEQRRLDALARFASKADRIRDLHPHQLELLALEPGLNEAEVDAVLDQPPAEQQAGAPAVEALVKTKRYKLKTHPGREELPAHLRREDILIDEAPAPRAGGILPRELRRDITERLAVIPAEYYVERITTVSYIFPGHSEKGVHHGSGPAALLPKSILGPSVVIDFVISKYADHLPVYRQVMALARDYAITLSYPTADRAVIDTAALAIPLSGAMLRELKAGGYIQGDETRMPVMDPRVKGKTATGYMWTYSHPRGQVVCRYHPGRGGKYARSDLDGFAGWLQSDGYQVYQSLSGFFGESVRHCACLSHVRRKFVEIVRANQDVAGFSTIVATAAALVARIGELYAIERQLKDAGAGEATRKEVRTARSLPLFDQLIKEMNAAAIDENLLPGSALARACRYALHLRPQLRRSLENGITEIDNNRCEQSICLSRRPTAPSPFGQPAAGCLSPCQGLRLAPRVRQKERNRLSNPPNAGRAFRAGLGEIGA